MNKRPEPRRIVRTFAAGPAAHEAADYPWGYTWGVQLPDEVVNDLRRRLRRIEGQVRGLEAMLAEGRECRDVVTQLSAATKALEQVGFRLIASGLVYCLEHPDDAEASGYPLDEVQRLFTKLA